MGLWAGTDPVCRGRKSVFRTDRSLPWRRPLGASRGVDAARCECDLAEGLPDFARAALQVVRWWLVGLVHEPVVHDARERHRGVAAEYLLPGVDSLPFSGPRLGTVQPALKGVDPDREPGAPLQQSLNRDAERRMLIERGLFGRVPPTALAPPLGGLRASPSFGGIGSTQSLGGRRFFKPLVGIGAQPFGGRGPGAIGAQPFSGRGPQTPSGSMGASGGRGGG